METRHFINNEFVEGKGPKFKTINPATEEVLAEVPEATKEEIDMAVRAAQKGLEAYSQCTSYVRQKMLLKLADLCEQNADELARIESLDNGKPLSIAKRDDVFLLIRYFRYYAGWTDKIYGTTREVTADGRSYKISVCKEPIGVVGHIIPWNFPLAMLAWKVAPALAAGCCMVLKTSEKTPLSALQFCKYIKEAGFPAGVVNVVSGPGPTTGNYIVEHPDVKKIAFTGSSAVGKQVAAKAAVCGLKRITLELGGKSPLVVCDDADLQHAVNVAHHGLFYNMGQCCIASSRVYVHESVYDKFVEMCVEKAKTAKMLPPTDPQCDQGPQIDKIQFDKILNYIKSGQEEGAKIMCGGKQYGKKGYWIEPTVFVDVKEDMKICKEEIFGPVICISKFSKYDEVILKSNDTCYGLGAGICTENIHKAMTLASQLKAGTVYVNCWNVFDSNIPFGGYKESGLGREGGCEALHNYLEDKTIVSFNAGL